MAARSHLVVYTFAILDDSPDDPDDPQLRRLFAESRAIRAAVALAPGFLGQAAPAGPIVQMPRFFDPSRYSIVLQSLSWWTNLDAVRTFVAAPAHAVAMRRHYGRVIRGTWPAAALWWSRTIPTFDEGIARLEYLHDHGSSTHVFAFPTVVAAQHI